MNSHYSMSYEQCLSELNSTGNAEERVADFLATGVSTCRGRPLTRDASAACKRIEGRK
jgi:hypothetical protein